VPSRARRRITRRNKTKDYTWWLLARPQWRLAFSPNFQGGGQKHVYFPLRTPMKVVHRISWKTKCPWKNFKWSGNPMHMALKFLKQLLLSYTPHWSCHERSLANSEWIPVSTVTQADNLTILAGIQPAELRRKGATLFLARRATEPGHLLHSALTECQPGSNARRFKSRHPFVLAAQLISSSDNNNGCAAPWTVHQRKAEWLDNLTRLRISIYDTGTHPPGMTLPRTAWVLLCTGVGRFRSCLPKWGMASIAACECCAEEQTVNHVHLQCPIHRPPHGLHGLTVLDDKTNEWLLNTCPEI